eukprot:gene275-508_t
MALSFEETLHEDFCTKLRVNKILANERSAYQDIFIFENDTYGTVLCLDGILQLSTADEHIYHEMITHVPLMTKEVPNMRGAIIGGGDGGVLREVLKHPNVQSCTLIDIDERVIELSKKHLPTLSAGAFDNHRATILSTDGSRWLDECASDTLDFLIVDSSDPVGPNQSLFDVSFYEAASKALKEDGIIVKQSGCSLVQYKEVAETLMRMGSYFKSWGTYRQNVPIYTGGDMTFVWGSKSKIDLSRMIPKDLTFDTMHYTCDIHKACFALPRSMHS